jgi:hypothetical protein
MLLESPRLVDQALEDTPDGRRVERWLCLPSEPLEHVALSFRVVNGQLSLALELSNGENEPDAFGDELEDTLVHFIDGAA